MYTYVYIYICIHVDKFISSVELLAYLYLLLTTVNVIFIIINYYLINLYSARHLDVIHKAEAVVSVLAC